MKDTKMQVSEFCKKNNIDEKLFFVASDSDGYFNDKKLKYKINSKTAFESKYILRYFKTMNVVIIWNRLEHVLTSVNFSALKKDVYKAIDDKINYFIKAVEHENWKYTKVFCDTFENLEKLLNKVIEEN